MIHARWDTLIHLARHGANLEVRPLICSAIELCCSSGLAVEAKGLAGRTVLMYAAESGLDDVAWSSTQRQTDSGERVRKRKQCDVKPHAYKNIFPCNPSRSRLCRIVERTSKQQWRTDIKAPTIGLSKLIDKLSTESEL